MSDHPPAYPWDDSKPCSDTYITPAVIALLQDMGAKEVLDAGCGNGALSGELASRGFHVVGIDGDGAGLERARRLFPDVRFKHMLFSQEPMSLEATADGRFDAVVSTEVVEHLYAPHELASFSFAALRPGGTLLMSTPYHGYLKNMALSLFDGWDRHFTADWHGGHIKFWSRKTLSALLTQAGFRVTGFKGVGRFPYLWKSMIIKAEKP